MIGETKNQTIGLDYTVPPPKTEIETVAGNLYYIYVILYNNNIYKYIYKTNY